MFLYTVLPYICHFIKLKSFSVSDREGSGGGMRQAGKRSGNRRRPNLDDADDEPYQPQSRKQEVDPNYVDPLGPSMERPKTAAKRRDLDDEFADEELGDDLLPE